MSKRCYHQHCGLARALDRVGERWTLLIVRDLLLGPRRYNQLLTSLEGITTNLLALRLKEMEESNIVLKTGRGPATRYHLSLMGEALEPVVMELARWGGHFMSELTPGDKVDLGWALLSRKRVYQGGEQMVVSIVADGRSFELTFTPGKLSVKERVALHSDLMLRGTTSQILALVFEGCIDAELVAQESTNQQDRSLSFLERLLVALKVMPLNRA
jgi:DNA-binding HxlR family transcriptional regulator